MTKIMKIPALVPMKGHSERVPGKNMKNLHGKPLCSYVLNALKSSKHIEDIYVDTDSQEIADYVEEHFGAKIIRRPNELCGDMVPMTDILRHDVGLIHASVFLQTHSTNPLLKASTIDRAIETFFRHSTKESLVGMTRIQSRLFWASGTPINHNPKVLVRTQDLDPVFEENSCLYIFKKDFIHRTGVRFDGDAIIFEMNKVEAIDIDTNEDFELAEYVLRGQDWKRK